MSPGLSPETVRTRDVRSKVVAGLAAGGAGTFADGRAESRGFGAAAARLLAASRMPRAMSANASSRFFHVVTGFPFSGRAWSFPNGAVCQARPAGG